MVGCLGELNGLAAGEDVSLEAAMESGILNTESSAVACAVMVYGSDRFTA